MKPGTGELVDQQDQPSDKSANLAGNCGGPVKAVQVGDLCPTCHEGRLDYDGMLNLACPKCGTVINTGGAFT